MKFSQRVPRPVWDEKYLEEKEPLILKSFNFELFENGFPYFGEYDSLDELFNDNSFHVNNKIFFKDLSGKPREFIFEDNSQNLNCAKISIDGIDYDVKLDIGSNFLIEKAYGINFVEMARRTSVYYENIRYIVEKLTDMWDLLEYKENLVESGGDGYEYIFVDEFKKLFNNLDLKMFKLNDFLNEEIIDSYFDKEDSHVLNILQPINGVDCFTFNKSDVLKNENSEILLIEELVIQNSSLYYEEIINEIYKNAYIGYIIDNCYERKLVNGC